MNIPKKLIAQQQASQQQEAQAALDQHARQGQAGQEFGSVDQMLRHDALHTPVPPAIARRLGKSLKGQGPPVSWWRRWFGSP